MRILIYGAGAVGCYLGAHLALAGHRITLLGRESLLKAVEADGLALHLPEGDRLIRDLSVVSSPDDAFKSDEAYDWIAFTMKAYDTLPAIYEMLERLPEPPPIASFQNGVGNEESLRAAFGEERIVAGTLTTAVSMPDARTVVEERQRGVAIATDSPAVAVVEAALRSTTLALEAVDHWRSLKWSKLLVNNLGNATSAILDLLPARVFKVPALFRIELGTLREALSIMELEGIEVANLPGTPVRLLARAARLLPWWLIQPVLSRQVAGGRGEKPPSLLAALRAGRTRTEAPWLNGAVAQAASGLNRLVPINHALALLVTDIAAGRVAWDQYRHRPDMLIAAIRAAQGMR